MLDTLIVSGTWWTKKITAAMAGKIDRKVAKTTRWGTSSSGPPMSHRFTIAKAKIAIRTPKVHWLPRSRRKFPISRGPYLPAAWVTATRVSENITPVTPITDEAMVDRSVRAPSRSRSLTTRGRANSASRTQWSAVLIPHAAITAATTRQAGMNQ